MDLAAALADRINISLTLSLACHTLVMSVHGPLPSTAADRRQVSSIVGLYTQVKDSGVPGPASIYKSTFGRRPLYIYYMPADGWKIGSNPKGRRHLFSAQEAANLNALAPDHHVQGSW